MNLSIFDVVLVDFTYVEQLNKTKEERESKNKPALILGRNVDSIVVAIGPHLKLDDREITSIEGIK